MFCDETNIFIQAGKGGDGSLSFYRAKYTPKGGPDGGDGGRGGDVLFRATRNLNSLIHLHTKKKFHAEKGEGGMPKDMHGKNANDLILDVPVGSQIFDTDQDELLADLKNDGDELIACVGGRGGYGNAHFTSSIRQAPRFAELGEPGETRNVHIELKLVADLGIIGIPSAGKSTFIAAVSAARPKIGNFPFTTLVPNLGVAPLSNGRSLVLCDIPGLIEGAHEGKGLGHEFLRHISRNRVLVHLVDSTENDLPKNYHIIREELRKYDSILLEKEEIIVLTKTDLLGNDPELLEMVRKDFADAINKKTSDVFLLSSVSHQGTTEVLEKAFAAAQKEKEEEWKKNPPEKTERILYQPHLTKNPKSFTVEEIKAPQEAEERHFRISGKRIEQIVIMSDMSNEEAVLRVRDIFRKMGVEKELLRKEAKKGDLLFIGKKQIDFQPNLFKKGK